jgi:hypothetical protein
MLVRFFPMENKQEKDPPPKYILQVWPLWLMWLPALIPKAKIGATRMDRVAPCGPPIPKRYQSFRAFLRDGSMASPDWAPCRLHGTILRSHGSS